MATGNTTLLKLALPIEGGLDGTWGGTINDSITSLLDSAVAGATTLSTDADVTLSDTALAANQARQAILIWTASNGATTRNITAPARSKQYAVINDGTGSVVLRGAGPTTGITIVSGERCVAAWNGSDFVKLASTVLPAASITGTVAVANGGTGASSAATARTNLGATTVGANLFTLSNPSAVTFPRFNADNTVSALDAASFRVAIGAGTGAGTVTSVTASSPLASSGGATPNISFAGVLAAANGGTGNANGTVSKLATTNFSIEESGGKLIFKYGGATIASMDSSGNLTSLADVTAYGTP